MTFQKTLLAARPCDASAPPSLAPQIFGKSLPKLFDLAIEWPDQKFWMIGVGWVVLFLQEKLSERSELFFPEEKASPIPAPAPKLDVSHD